MSNPYGTGGPPDWDPSAGPDYWSAPPPQGFPPYPGGPSPYPGGPAPWPDPARRSGMLATFGVRLGAWLIDWALLLIVEIPVLLLTHSIHHLHHTVYVGTVATQQNSNVTVGPLGALLVALIAIVYGTIMCGSPRGQTLGMRFLGLRVVDANGGGPIGMPRALGRAAFEYAMSILLIIPWIIDMLFPLWDARKQTLHDKVTSAVVIRV